MSFTTLAWLTGIGAWDSLLYAGFPLFSVMLSTLPDCNFANTESILMFRPALKNYDPNSSISEVFGPIWLLHHGDIDRNMMVDFRNFTKIHFHHPTVSAGTRNFSFIGLTQHLIQGRMSESVHNHKHTPSAMLAPSWYTTRWCTVQ